MTPLFMALFAGVRALHLASIMILFGSALLLDRLRRLVPELAIESRGLRHTRLAAMVLALLSAPLWLALAAAQMAGANSAMTDSATLGLIVRDTLFGQMLAARLLLLFALAGALAMRREGAAALLSALALVSISVTSHASAASPGGFSALGIAGDWLHLLCAGFWLGGLVVLAAIMILRPEATRLHRAVSLFADWAMIAVALLAMTGLLNAATIVLGGEGHAARLYLGVLGAKLVLVLAMVMLALANHFRLLPRLADPEIADPGTRAILKGNIAWELGLGLTAVALAALLGMLPPTQ
jgi:putative copper resistance protein D